MEKAVDTQFEPSLIDENLKLVGLTEDFRGGFEGFTLHNPIFSTPSSPDYVFAKLGARWPYDSKSSLGFNSDLDNPLSDGKLNDLNKYSRTEIARRGGIFFDADNLNLLPNFTKLTPDQVIATYTEDFLLALKNIGFDNIQFDFEINGFKLAIIDKDRFEELSLEYGKKAMGLLRVELGHVEFGNSTDLMSNSAQVLLEDSGLVDSEKWILFNLYAIHTKDFQTAAKFLSGNRIFLQRSLEEVVDLLHSRYREIKPDADDDLEKFIEFIERVKTEVVRRDRSIEEKLAKYQN